MDNIKNEKTMDEIVEEIYRNNNSKNVFKGSFDEIPLYFAAYSSLYGYSYNVKESMYYAYLLAAFTMIKESILKKDCNNDIIYFDYEKNKDYIPLIKELTKPFLDDSDCYDVNKVKVVIENYTEGIIDKNLIDSLWMMNKIRDSIHHGAFRFNYDNKAIIIDNNKSNGTLNHDILYSFQDKNGLVLDEFYDENIASRDSFKLCHELSIRSLEKFVLCCNKTNGSMIEANLKSEFGKMLENLDKRSYQIVHNGKIMTFENNEYDMNALQLLAEKDYDLIDKINLVMSVMKGYIDCKNVTDKNIESFINLYTYALMLFASREKISEVEKDRKRKILEKRTRAELENTALNIEIDINDKMSEEEIIEAIVKNFVDPRFVHLSNITFDDRPRGLVNEEYGNRHKKVKKESKKHVDVMRKINEAFQYVVNKREKLIETINVRYDYFDKMYNKLLEDVDQIYDVIRNGNAHFNLSLNGDLIEFTNQKNYHDDSTANAKVEISQERLLMFLSQVNGVGITYDNWNNELKLLIGNDNIFDDINKVNRYPEQMKKRIFILQVKNYIINSQKNHVKKKNNKI